MKRQNASISPTRSTDIRTASASVVTPSARLARRSALGSTKKDVRFNFASMAIGIHRTRNRHTPQDGLGGLAPVGAHYDRSTKRQPSGISAENPSPSGSSSASSTTVRSA